MRIEHSRKHGPFDSRYPPIRHKPPVSLWRLGEERTDWQRFLARFYSGCRKVRAAQRDVCDGHEGVSDVSRRRGVSGDEARRVGEGIESAVSAITVMLVAARSVNIFT